MSFDSEMSFDSVYIINLKSAGGSLFEKNFPKSQDLQGFTKRP